MAAVLWALAVLKAPTPEMWRLILEKLAMAPVSAFSDAELSDIYAAYILLDENSAPPAVPSHRVTAVIGTWDLISVGGHVHSPHPGCDPSSVHEMMLSRGPSQHDGCQKHLGWFSCRGTPSLTSCTCCVSSQARGRGCPCSALSARSAGERGTRLQGRSRCQHAAEQDAAGGGAPPVGAWRGARRAAPHAGWPLPGGHCAPQLQGLRHAANLCLVHAECTGHACQAVCIRPSCAPERPRGFLSHSPLVTIVRLYADSRTQEDSSGSPAPRASAAKKAAPMCI